MYAFHSRSPNFRFIDHALHAIIWQAQTAAMTEQSFTSDHVKQALKEIIATESPKKPYSDRILSEKLSERGITISRRTVAKYRDEAGIPDASGRKQF